MELHVANLAAYLGAGLAIGLGAIGSGWGIGYAVVGASRGMAKQPAVNSNLFRTMLISQAVASNPSIFALVVALLLFFQGGAKLDAPDSLAQAMAFLGAGLCIGIGALGAGAGNGLVAADALETVARTPQASGRVTIMMLLGQAMGQTPNLFSLVISLLLLFNTPGLNQLVGTPDDWIHAGRLLGMGLCMGAGAVGPAIGSSMVGGAACRGVADVPEHGQKINNTFFVGAGVSQSTSIYAFVISLLLMAYTV